VKMYRVVPQTKRVNYCLIFVCLFSYKPPLYSVTN